MTLEHVFALLGGLGLFLYGMHMMSNGLENAAGDRMKAILEKLTSNRILGVLVGALITAIIQSSSATTVMVVGFVNSNLMTLQQAVWIIMGANIGTTITGQLVALNVGELAPLVTIIGVVMVTFLKNKKINALGEVLAGLGVLFIGMGMMGDAMNPLRSEPWFVDAMTTISNPFLAVLLGAGFTALIQSSSASVGILQTLANSGLIGLHSSIYIIFGQNIGTCITAVLAALSASRNAKRTTIIHLSFNIIGTIIFMVAIQFIPFVDWMVAFTDNPAAQIANTHTIFNITTSLLLIPFGTQLAKFAEIVLPINDKDEDSKLVPLTFIDADNISSVPIALSSLRKEAVEMLELSKLNLIASIQALYGEKYELSYINDIEDRIDNINVQVTDYMSKVSLLNMNRKESDTINSLFKCFADIERMGDHAMNIIEYAEEHKLNGTDLVKAELKQLEELLEKNYEMLFTYNAQTNDTYEKVERIEDRIDELTAQFRENQIIRLSEKKVSSHDTVVYSEIMTDIERVSDHMMNIIEECRRCEFSLTEELFENQPV